MTHEQRPNADHRREDIIATHHQLRAALRRLERLDLPAQMAPALEEFYCVLQRHFEQEETRDGLYDIIRQKAPGRAHSVCDLLAEHRQLLRTVRDLRQLAWESPGSMAILPEAAELSQLVRDHERREMQLLFSSLSAAADKPL